MINIKEKMNKTKLMKHDHDENDEMMRICDNDENNKE